MPDLRGVLAPGAPTEEIFTPNRLAEAMLSFEAALARRGAAAGLVPAAAAERIAAACEEPSWLDVAALLRATGTAGTPVIPLLAALRGRLDPADAEHVHVGATTQDVVDTAIVLLVRDGLSAIVADLDRIAERAAALAAAHRSTAMIGRTLLRSAAPISFGLRSARWLGTADHCAGRLLALRDALALQLGGAVGTQAALGPQAAAVEEELAARLGLAVPPLPWHAERERMAEVVVAVGVSAAALGKIATDLLLLSSEEVGEVVVPGGGGSSAMPHKRNPVELMLARSATRLATGSVGAYLSSMEQEHERGPGGWQAEWVLVADVLRAGGACAHRLAAVFDSLQARPERMAANLRRDGGLAMSEGLAAALGGRLGRAAAKRKVGELAAAVADGGRTLAEVAADDDAVAAALGEDLAAVLDPAANLGSAERLIDRAIAAHERRRLGRAGGRP